jgi:hypothetical protein
LLFKLKRRGPFMVSENSPRAGASAFQAFRDDGGDEFDTVQAVDLDLHR